MGDWAWEREPAIDDLQWSSRVAQQVTTTTTTTRLLQLLQEEEEGEEKECGEWRAMRARGSNSHSSHNSNSSEWHKGCWWWPTVCLCLPFVMGMVGI
jgi:hypothetical protein